MNHLYQRKKKEDYYNIKASHGAACYRSILIAVSLFIIAGFFSSAASNIIKLPHANAAELDGNIFLNLVKFYARNGDLERAMIELKKLRKLEPRNVEYKKFEEILRSENEKWSNEFKDIVNRAPGQNDIANSTGPAENKFNREPSKNMAVKSRSSEQDLPPEVIEKNNAIARGRLRYVYELIGRGDSRQAILKLKEIIKTEPNFYEANNLLGDLYLASKNYDDALGAFQKAIKTRQDAELNYKIGICFKARNDIDNAIIRFDTAIRMNPSHELANLNIANIWRFKKNFKIAKNYYEQALKANPRLAEAHLGMADCIFNEGNIDEATRAYAYIVTNFASEYSGYLGLARILILNKQYKEANAAILKAREISPRNSQVYEMLGILSYSQKDNKNAIEYFKRAVMFDSNNLTAYRSLINILIDEKKFEDALVQIKNCLAKFPANPELYYLAGIIYSGFKNDTLALKNLMEAYRLDAENMETILAIALINEKNYKYKDALEKYREALLIAEEKKDARYINNIHEKIDMLEKKVEKFTEDKQQNEDPR